MEEIIKLIIVAVFMAGIDGLWLTIIAKNFYKNNLKGLLLAKPNMSAAVSFYIIYVIGITYFVLTPALSQSSLIYAVGMGAFFGMVAYATYDLTNLSTLKGFATKVALVDITWGVMLTATVSTLSYLVISAYVI